jgi:hypothetical protein
MQPVEATEALVVENDDAPITRRSIIARGDGGKLLKVKGVVGIVTDSGYRVNFDPRAVGVIYRAFEDRRLDHCTAMDGTHITVDGKHAQIANHVWAVRFPRGLPPLLEDVANTRKPPKVRVRKDVKANRRTIRRRSR